MLPNQTFSFKLTGLSKLIYLINTITEKQKDNTYGPKDVSSDASEVRKSPNVGDIVEFSNGYTATVTDIEPGISESYHTNSGYIMRRMLDYRSKKAISVHIMGNMTIDQLTAFCADTVFPKQVEFKKINPGEQTPGSFNPVNYAHTNEWYLGFLYHTVDD